MVDGSSIERLDGRTLADRFTLERFVARGGYGVVYRARHCTLDCATAVKVFAVPEQLQGQARERSFAAFVREARTVATLRHPAIVRVLDSGVTDIDGVPHPFIAMEWIDGVPLDVKLREERGQRRSPVEALALLRPVLDAIASAHEAGVVHRDLKPGNLMVVTAGRGEAQARVLDFGVAKVMSPDELGAEHIERTTDAFSCFSLSHAAPEQVGRLRTGPWTDVHALALLLVELMVGTRALRGSNSVELFSSITSKQRPTPASFGVEVGPWEEILGSSLSLIAADRPRDAGVLLAALESTLAAAQDVWSHPIHTTAPAPPVERPSRTTEVDRSWRPFALATLAMVSLGAWSVHNGMAPPPGRPVHTASMSTSLARPRAEVSPSRLRAPSVQVARAEVAPSPAEKPVPAPAAHTEAVRRPTHAPPTRASARSNAPPARVEVDGIVID
ncbi:MAG: protein kinase [Polyangiales bacterium]